MKQVPLMPLFLMEVETGYMDLFETPRELRLMVEQYWSKLDYDFKFWDKNARPVKISKEFIDGDDFAMDICAEGELETLKGHLLRFAYDKKVAITEDFADPAKLYLYIMKMLPRTKPQ